MKKEASKKKSVYLLVFLVLLVIVAVLYLGREKPPARQTDMSTPNTQARVGLEQEFTMEWNRWIEALDSSEDPPISDGGLDIKSMRARIIAENIEIQLEIRDKINEKATYDLTFGDGFRASYIPDQGIGFWKGERIINPAHMEARHEGNIVYFRFSLRLTEEEWLNYAEITPSTRTPIEEGNILVDTLI